MTAVVGRAWGWLQSWRGGASPENATATPAPTPMPEGQKQRRGLGGWTSWIWGGWRRQGLAAVVVEEEYWEAQEKLQPVEIDGLHADPGRAPRWWSRWLPTSYLPWPRRRRRELGGVRRRGPDDDDGDFRTPPPSPTPPLPSPFRLFAQGWEVEVVPEHYEICFNFLRHLFDLFTVGFLWTVSPPTKLVLEVLGVQGALRLWLHGMAMFFVSTVGMAGLLWLVQEYLPQFALIYGIIQALVISVSIRQSVITGVDEEEEAGEEEEGKETEGMAESREHKEKLVC